MTDTPLATALGKIPSGIFVLTARSGSEETGMLASWVQQAGFEPPMVTLAVGKQRRLVDWLALDAPLVLNVVGHGQTGLLRHFGKGFEPGEPAFEGLPVRRTPQNLAILEAAMAYLDCRVRGRINSGDHQIVLAEVVAGEVLREGEPLVHLRRNGLKY